MALNTQYHLAHGLVWERRPRDLIISTRWYDIYSGGTLLVEPADALKYYTLRRVAMAKQRQSKFKAMAQMVFADHQKAHNCFQKAYVRTLTTLKLSAAAMVSYGYIIRDPLLISTVTCCV